MKGVRVYISIVFIAACQNLDIAENTIKERVNEEEGLTDSTNSLYKCCPLGEVLGANLSCITGDDSDVVPPRMVIDHKTEEVTGQYQLR